MYNVEKGAFFWEVGHFETNEFHCSVRTATCAVTVPGWVRENRLSSLHKTSKEIVINHVTSWGFQWEVIRCIDELCENLEDKQVCTMNSLVGWQAAREGGSVASYVAGLTAPNISMAHFSITTQYFVVEWDTKLRNRAAEFLLNGSSRVVLLLG